MGQGGLEVMNGAASPYAFRRDRLTVVGAKLVFALLHRGSGKRVKNRANTRLAPTGRTDLLPAAWSKINVNRCYPFPVRAFSSGEV